MSKTNSTYDIYSVKLLSYSKCFKEPLNLKISVILIKVNGPFHLVAQNGDISPLAGVVVVLPESVLNSHFTQLQPTYLYLKS